MLNFDLFSLIVYLVRFNAINKHHFLTYMLKCMSTSQLCHYSRAIWTSLYRFWPHVTWAPTFVKMCGRKFKFFANYDKWLQQSRNFHYEAFKTHKTWFPALLPWTLPRLCIWTLSKGLTASCAPELHHLLLTRRGSPLKKKNLE